MAWWLGKQVGPSGSVGTDLDLHVLGGIRAPNIPVQRHKALTDDLPEHGFDLVHTRAMRGFFLTRGGPSRSW
jgi:hypothetical protein